MFLQEDLFVEVMQMVEERDNKFRKSKNGDIYGEKCPPIELLALNVVKNKRNNRKRRRRKKEIDEDKAISAWQHLGNRSHVSQKVAPQYRKKGTASEEPLIQSPTTPFEEVQLERISAPGQDHQEGRDSIEETNLQILSKHSSVDYPDMAPDLIEAIDNDDNLESLQSTDTVKAQAMDDIHSSLGLAVFVTLCCCLPMGAVAIFYSVKANQSMSGNDMTAAKRKARLSRTLSLVGLGIGIVVCITISIVRLVM